jgi:Uma2 family endonuclease
MMTGAQPALEDLDVPDGCPAELINEKMVLSPPSKLRHWNIQRSLVEQFLPHGGNWATDQTIVHPVHGDMPQPDFLAMPAIEIDPEEFLPGDQVQIAVEVLSKSTKGNDLVDKVGVYARFGIPIYLIIDPFKGQCVLCLHPEGEGYAEKRISSFGLPICLPEPVGFTLQTSSFGTYKKQT